MSNIAYGGQSIDLSQRLAVSTAIVASPAGAAETIVASVAIPSGIQVLSGVLVMGWVAYTLGTTAASAAVRVRQSTVTGTVVSSTGAMTGGHNTAGQLVADDVNGFDTGAAPGQVYKLTLTVASATAASTVSQVWLAALAV